MATATTALAEKPALPPVKPPRVDTTKFVRLTDACGLTMWGWISEHSLSDMLASGYFDATRKYVERFDRIIVTASADSAGPVHAVLVIDAADRDSVNVKVLSRSDRG